MQKLLRNTLVILLFGLLFLPMAQLTVQLFEEPKLEGIGKSTYAPTLRWASWMDGTYQDTLTEYANQHCGFHSTMVRLNNQYYYSLFNTALANGVIIGKNHYLYDRAHIAAYTGTDFLGVDTLRARMQAIRDLRDILARKKIQLAVVFVPGKATGTPEFLPVGTPPAGQQTNYKSYLHFADSLGVPALDLIAWYQREKQTSPYPLYPSGGIHWSQYCAALAMDTLMGYLSDLMQTPLNRLKVTGVDWSWTPQGQDNDIDRGMNLLFPNSGYPMVYPNLKWTGVPPKFSVMTVGDSYYFKAFTDYSGAAFAKSYLWFYHNELHTWGNMVTRRNNEVDIIKEIESKDLIILYTADANLKLFSWGFVDEALAAYRDPVRRAAEIARLSDVIRADSSWFQRVAAAAIDSQVPVDTMLRRNATFVLDNGRSQ